MLSWFPILRTMFISIKLLDVNLTKQGILLYTVWVCWSKSCAIQPQSTCRGFTSSQGQLAERWFFRFGCYSWKREMWPDQNKLALAKYSLFSKSRRCRKEKHHISWMLNCFLKIYFEIIGWYDNTIYYALFFFVCNGVISSQCSSQIGAFVTLRWSILAIFRLRWSWWLRTSSMNLGIDERTSSASSKKGVSPWSRRNNQIFIKI